MKTTALAIFMLLLCGTASGQREASVKVVQSVKSCGQYLEARRLNRHDVNWFVMHQWGFLSGYNVFSTAPQIAIPDRDSMLAYFDKYCAANPLHWTSQGTARLIAELGGVRW